MGARDVGELERHPASGPPDTWGEVPMTDLGETRKSVGLTLEGEGDITESSTASPKERPVGNSTGGLSSLSRGTVTVRGSPFFFPVALYASPSDSASASRFFLC